MEASGMTELLDLGNSVEGVRQKKAPVKKSSKGRSVSREDFFDVLDLLRPGLSTKGIVDQSGDYLFGEDWIATYNDLVCVVANFPTGVSGSVSGSTLYKLFSGVQSSIGSVGMEATGKGLKFTSDKYGFSVPLKEADYTETGKTPGMHGRVKSLLGRKMKVEPLPEGLVEALVLCSFYASRDMTMPALTGVFVSGKDVVSSDRYRITLCKLKEELPSFNVPAYGVVHLSSKYNLTWFASDGDWVSFGGDKLRYSVRLQDNKFDVDYNKFFPKLKSSGDRNWSLPSQQLVAALDRSRVLLSDQPLLEESVLLKIGKGSIECVVDDRKTGSMVEEIDFDTSGSEVIEVSMNPLFLKEALKHDVKLVFVDDSRVMFQSEKFKHLISLT